MNLNEIGLSLVLVYAGLTEMWLKITSDHFYQSVHVHPFFLMWLNHMAVSYYNMAEGLHCITWVWLALRQTMIKHYVRIFHTSCCVYRIVDVFCWFLCFYHSFGHDIKITSCIWCVLVLIMKKIHTKKWNGIFL